MMKVFGFVIIVIGLIMVYIGVTGNQHNLMATIKGSNSPVPSGQSINLGGTNNTTSSNSSNNSSSSPGTNSGDVAI